MSRTTECLLEACTSAAKTRPVPYSSCGPCQNSAMADGAAIPRTRTALADYLTELGVSENSYHLYGTRLDDAIVLDERPEGWVVFYSERGGESALKVHSTEAEARALAASNTAAASSSRRAVAG